MSRPDQSDIKLFEGERVNDFIEYFELLCYDYDLMETKKCTPFPNYCTSEIKDVKLLSGYVKNDQESLTKEMKELF